MNEDPTRLLPNDTNAMFARILVELQSMNARLTTLESDNVEIKQRLTALESDNAEIKLRLTTLDEKVDRRLQETRPIWEAVLYRLEKLEARFDNFQNEIKDMRRALRTDFTAIDRAQADIEDRVDRLEGRNAA